MKDPEFPAGVLVRGRRAGKTTSCLEWLLKGHPVKRAGGVEWSRLLIVSDNRMLEQILRRTLPRWHEIDHLLQQRGLPHGLAGCVISGQAFRNGRHRGRRDGGPEIMVDDADLLIQQALGFWPDYLVVTGREFDPNGEPDPWMRGGRVAENGALHEAWFHRTRRELHFHRDPHYQHSADTFKEAIEAAEAEEPYAGWTEEERRRLYEGRWESDASAEMSPSERKTFDLLRMKTRLARATEEDDELRHGLGSPDAEGGRGDLEPPAHDGT